MDTVAKIEKAISLKFLEAYKLEQKLYALHIVASKNKYPAVWKSLMTRSKDRLIYDAVERFIKDTKPKK